MAVGIMEFHDEKVIRERIYFGEPWEPPASRAQWVERFDPRAWVPQLCSGESARIRGLSWANECRPGDMSCH
jgi:hypothetical protein